MRMRMQIVLGVVLNINRRHGGSTSRVFPLPLQHSYSSSFVPKSRRLQMRHRINCHVVTIVNVVIASLNALALGGSLCDPIASSSCFSLPSSVQSNIIRSVYVRVRSFVAGVRRRGQVGASSSGVSSFSGLCDSLFRWISSVYSSVPSTSISSCPSSVLHSFFLSDSSGWEASVSNAINQTLSTKSITSITESGYLRDALLRDRAVPIIASRISLPSSLRPVPLLSSLPPDMVEIYSKPSALVLRDVPLKVDRRPHIFGSHSEYVRLIRRMITIGMVSLTNHPKVINGVFAVPKDTQEDRLIIDAVFANAFFSTPTKVELPDPSHLARLCASSGSSVYVIKSDLSNYYHHLELPEWIRPYFCLVGIPSSELDLPGDCLVYPMCNTVPMGWSHSVLVAQSVHEHTLYSSGALRREQSLLARLASSGDGRTLIGDDPIHGIYIDDMFALSTDSQSVDSLLDRCIDAYRNRGFVVKDSKVVRATKTGVIVLGLLIDGEHLTVQVDPIARIQLIQSILRLISQPTVSGYELASLVGSLTWCMLVRRPSLQCLNRVYSFMHARRDRPSQLWPSAIRELLIACGLLPLLSADLSLSKHDRVVATDASSFGGAVVAKRDNELSWTTIISHRWRWTHEHINVLEMRAILLSLVWLVSCRVLHRCTPLLTDSMVCLGVLNKGRTSSPTLSRVHSVIAALCLGANIVLMPTHIPSELNPADGPSRFQFNHGLF